MTVLNDCGCCEGLMVETPFTVQNRPGLSSIAYRVGTHSQFKASMLSRLSASDLRPLSALKTREEDDFTIALLDAWAVVADILTFYQERIANESYLRTATERQSIINLARLIGYELRPGVAASTYLAFTTDTGPLAPKTISLAPGLKVQSVPGPDEKPQTFETMDELEVRPDWNALIPRQTAVHLPASGDLQLMLAGVTTNLKPGDALLIVGDERLNDANSELWQFRRITAVVPDNDKNRTVVQWAKELEAKKVPQRNPRIYALRLNASLFGYNAQDWASLPVALRIGEIDPKTGTFKKGAYRHKDTEWADAKFAAGTTSINLDSVYKQIVPDSWAVLTSAADTQLYKITAVVEDTATGFNLSAKSSHLTISGPNIEKFSPKNAAVYAQSEELFLTGTPIEEPVWQNAIELDDLVEDLQPGRTLIVTGKRMRIEIPATRRLRRKVIFTPAHPEDETVAEVVTLKDTKPSDDGERTILELNETLKHVYDRTTVVIDANVAFSTHGETVADEILGSGDAGAPYQHFTLRQSPLTYTPADTASGGETSLEVRVNDLTWNEVQTLYGHGPRERIYTTHIDDDGTTTVQFGDGHTGARLPMGRENVKATYRKGIGLDGLVDAGQLSLLMTRPLGLRGVVNPLAASGAQDPQIMADARTNAPVTVLTLDRIVSLQDYEDFARAFSGIAKAQATWTWTGHARQVFLTVAGIDGAQVEDDLQKTLISAMRKAGDELVPIAVRKYRPAEFQVEAKIKIDEAYIAENVLAAVEAALRDRFSFAAREFGQPVTLSEVIAVMQDVAGVIAVDVDRLYRTDGVGADDQTYLPSASPGVGDGPSAEAAELLTISSAPVVLKVMS